MVTVDAFNPFPTQGFSPRAARVTHGSNQTRCRAGAGAEGDPGGAVGERRQRRGGFLVDAAPEEAAGTGARVGRKRARRGRGGDGDESAEPRGVSARGRKGGNAKERNAAEAHAGRAAGACGVQGTA